MSPQLRNHNPVIGYRRDGRPIYAILGGAPNPVLDRLIEQRTEQETFVDQTLARVDEEGRDLVEAERNNLNAARERIRQLDEQIQPLEDFESVRAQHRSNRPAGPRNNSDDDAGEDRSGDQSRRLGVNPREVKYGTAGEFIVDAIRAYGYPGEQRKPDPDAQQRVAAALGRAVAVQTTQDTPGLLPENIVGTVLNDLDASRPLVNSFGVKPLAGIPGKVFHRPHVTQHTQTGEQTEEKTELPSRQYKVEGVPFSKRTFGGTLNVSRQDIDWTSPSAWNGLVQDLQLEYGADTEDAASVDFAGAVSQSVEVANEDDITAWVKALYQAAVMTATANGTRRATALRLPDRIWASVDMWASLGAVVTAARATTASNDNFGSSSPFNFAGDILTLPRVMSPGLPDGTLIVGRTALFEVYEERIGLLQAIEPKILGVEVAYGGYATWGALDPTAFTKVAVAAPTTT